MGDVPEAHRHGQGTWVLDYNDAGGGECCDSSRACGVVVERVLARQRDVEKSRHRHRKRLRRPRHHSRGSGICPGGEYNKGDGSRAPKRHNRRDERRWSRREER